MQYVYKYVNDRSDVVYVGITNNMKNRIQQHKSDKLKNIKNPVIYYFPVKYRADAEMLETYLINYYGTGRYYNVSKTKKGDVSFLDNICDSLPWTRFINKAELNLEPFVVSANFVKEKIIEKKVYVDFNSTESAIRKKDEDAKIINEKLNELIDFENEIINKLQEMIRDFNSNDFIDKGLYLHKKRLLCARLMKKCFQHYPFFFSKKNTEKKWNRLNLLMESIKWQIEEHENIAIN